MHVIIYNCKSHFPQKTLIISIVMCLCISAYAYALVITSLKVLEIDESNNNVCHAVTQAIVLLITLHAIYTPLHIEGTKTIKPEQISFNLNVPP